jgi:hypothetical protein
MENLCVRNVAAGCGVSASHPELLLPQNISVAEQPRCAAAGRHQVRNRPTHATRGGATIFIVVIYAMMVMMTLGVLAWFVLNEGD